VDFFPHNLVFFIIEEKGASGVRDISVKGQHTKRETYIGLGILSALVGITIGVFLKQFHYNPAIFVASLPQSICPEIPSLV
jgi:hypothetical protein